METNNKIKSLANRIINSKYSPYIFIILLGIITTIPLFTRNLSEYNEFRIHIGRITTIKEVIEDGVFPPFISYKHMLGFGYALNIFYGSLTTYIPILISLITKSTTMALKFFTLITVVLSGITMYWFAFKVTKKKFASLVAALIYMLAPYKFTDIYSRNAVGEYTAFIFIPMVFHGIHNLLNNDKKGNYLLVIGSSLLILSHTITTIYVALFAIFYLAFNYKKLKNLTLWKYLSIDIVFILILTAFYTIPLLEHKMYGDYLIFDGESMNSTGAHVYQETNGISDWFKNELSNVKNERGEDELVFSFGIATTFLMIITIFCYKKIDDKYKDLYVIFWILALIALFMATKYFPWPLMPQFLTIIQFAWRLDGFFIFFISIVCGINAYVLINNVKNMKNVTSTLIISVICIMACLTAGKYIGKYENGVDEKFENTIYELESIGPFNINRDYMPLLAMKNMDYLKSREDKTIVTSGNALVISESKEKLHDTIEIEGVNKATLELPYLYYHGYTVKLNGKVIDNYENEKGFMCVNADEDGTIEVDYTGTALEKSGFVISAFGIPMLILWVVIEKRTKKTEKKN